MLISIYPVFKMIKPPSGLLVTEIMNYFNEKSEYTQLPYFTLVETMCTFYCHDPLPPLKLCFSLNALSFFTDLVFSVTASRTLGENMEIWPLTSKLNYVRTHLLSFHNVYLITKVLWLFGFFCLILLLGNPFNSFYMCRYRGGERFKSIKLLLLSFTIAVTIVIIILLSLF